MFNDKVLVCRDCGRDFEFSASLRTPAYFMPGCPWCVSEHILDPLDSAVSLVTTGQQLIRSITKKMKTPEKRTSMIEPKTHFLRG